MGIIYLSFLKIKQSFPCKNYIFIWKCQEYPAVYCRDEFGTNINNKIFLSETEDTSQLAARFFILLLLIILIPSRIYSDTYVGGRISSDIIWTKSGSPYIVNYDINIFGDSTNIPTLTIEHGVEVRFWSGSGISVGTLNNNGILRAIGTDTEKIIFTAGDANNPVPGYWKNIYFNDGAIDYDSNTGNGTIYNNY